MLTSAPLSTSTDGAVRATTFALQYQRASLSLEVCVGAVALLAKHERIEVGTDAVGDFLLRDAPLQY